MSIKFGLNPETKKPFESAEEAEKYWLFEKWEKGLTKLQSHQDPTYGTIISVLKDDQGLYYIHRYFLVDNEWKVSIDLQGKDDIQLVKRLFELKHLM